MLHPLNAQAPVPKATFERKPLLCRSKYDMRYVNRLGFQPLLFTVVPNPSHIIPGRFVKGTDLTVQPKDVGPAAG